MGWNCLSGSKFYWSLRGFLGNRRARNEIEYTVLRRYGLIYARILLRFFAFYLLLLKLHWLGMIRSPRVENNHDSSGLFDFSISQPLPTTVGESPTIASSRTISSDGLWEKKRTYTRRTGSVAVFRRLFSDVAIILRSGLDLETCYPNI